MSRKIFVNLAVKDLGRSVDFFTKLGFSFDPHMTDETATCMIVSDEAFVMLLTEAKFREFTRKELVDTATQNEAILALSADSREAVDELAETALREGGSFANDPLEYGFMYGRSFNDLDGHLWEVFWMDPSALEQSPEAAASTTAA
jgi:predicted lactoylglutathione lyase